MASQKIINIATYSILALAGSVSVMLPQDLGVSQASAFVSEDVVRLTGTIRDFRKSHADFDVTPSAGYGHYAGNIDLIANDRRPTFLGGGARVSTQWRDRDAFEIAPHLFVETHAIETSSPPDMSNNPVVDTYDFSRGPYDEAFAGPAPAFVTVSTMPTITVPVLSAYQTEYREKGGSHTINSSFRCDDFILSNTATVRISGNVQIIVEDKFEITNTSSIELMPGATLELYIEGTFEVNNQAEINVNTWTPSRVTIFNLASDSHFLIKNDSHIYAQIISPDNTLNIENESHFYGVLTTKHLDTQNDCGVHVLGPPVVCGVQVSDMAGGWGVSSAGAITSSSTFSEWYADVISTNFSLPHTITLMRQSDDTYRYVNSAFHPIDDKLFGNEGDAHNFCFTYAIDTQFTYDACGSQFVELSGHDDIWMFVDEKLVIDLGGILAGMPQRIDMDRLQLIDGEEYSVRIFFAQRNTMSSSFNIKTNIDLTNAPEATYTGGFD